MHVIFRHVRILPALTLLRQSRNLISSHFLFCSQLYTHIIKRYYHHCVSYFFSELIIYTSTLVLLYLSIIPRPTLNFQSKYSEATLITIFRTQFVAIFLIYPHTKFRLSYTYTTRLYFP